MILRRGGTQDIPFMRDMLRHAYYWRADEAFEDEEPLSRYVNGWGRAGDTALVAIQGANPVGAAWYRLFTREHPGFGYVDDETPELAIAVVPNRRGGGMGSTLLDALVDRARAGGLRTDQPERRGGQPCGWPVRAARLREGRGV